MAFLAEKLFLLAACMAFAYVDPDFGLSVVPLITVVTASALLTYFEKTQYKLIVYGVYFALCLRYPQFLVYAPLMVYDFAAAPRYGWLCFLPLLPFVFHGSMFQALTIVFWLIMLIFSVLLRQAFWRMGRLQEEYRKFRDTNRESALQMEKKHSDLIEKQDYEVHLATLNERNRISRDIHDNVGHLLSRCLLQMGALLSVNKDAALQESMMGVKNTLSLAMDSIRSSVHNLHEESIDLQSQLEGLVKDFTFCSVILDCDIRGKLEKQIKYCFIVIVREGLSNVMKHSSATQVTIVLREQPAFYQMQISDNGKVSSYNKENGIGLTNIQERVQRFNGFMDITTDNGFKIFISIPKGVRG